MGGNHGVGVFAAQRHRGLAQQRRAFGQVFAAGAQVNGQLQVQARDPQHSQHIIVIAIDSKVQRGFLVGERVGQAALAPGVNFRVIVLHRGVQFRVGAFRLRGFGCGFLRRGGGGLGFGAGRKLRSGFGVAGAGPPLDSGGLYQQRQPQQNGQPGQNFSNQPSHLVILLALFAAVQQQKQQQRFAADHNAARYRDLRPGIHHALRKHKIRQRLLKQTSFLTFQIDPSSQLSIYPV